MVEADEAGGVLDEVLKRLAKLLEDTAKLQNQIKGALGYPVAVFGDCNSGIFRNNDLSDSNICRNL